MIKFGTTNNKGGTLSNGRSLIWVLAVILAAVLLFGGLFIFRASGQLGQNLVVNPSFEDWQGSLPKSWDLKSGNVVRSPDDSSNGKFAARLESASGAGQIAPAAISQNIIGLAADSKYKVGVWVKGGAGEINLAYSYDSMVNGQRITSQKTEKRPITPSQKYQEVSFEVFLPPGLNSIAGVLGIKTVGKESLTVDDATVSKEVPILPQVTHGVCQNNACVVAVGGGKSDCQSDADCKGLTSGGRKKFASQAGTNGWPVFTNPAYNYTVSYPPEFTVEKRGRVGQVEDLVAFNYKDGAKSLTVAKVEIHNQPASSQGLAVSRGSDADGNQVVVYTYPYGSTGKSIVILGTVYPTIGANFQFDAVLDQMSQTLKVK